MRFEDKYGPEYIFLAYIYVGWQKNLAHPAYDMRKNAYMQNMKHPRILLKTAAYVTKKW